MRVLGAVVVAVMLAFAVLLCAVPALGPPVHCEMDLPDFGVPWAACELCPAGDFSAEVRSCATKRTSVAQANEHGLEMLIDNALYHCTASMRRPHQKLPSAASHQPDNLVANHAMRGGRSPAGV